MNKDTPADHPSQPVPKVRHGIALPVALLTFLVSGTAVAGSYLLAYAQAAHAARENAVLATQMTTLTSKLKHQADVNNGVVQASETYKEPMGGLGLLDGAVTFTLPTGWTRTPNSYCQEGTIDSTALCEDTAAITGGANTPAVSIGVFDYDPSDGDAKAWFEAKYYGRLSSYNMPKATDISTDQINGYSALSFSMVAAEGDEVPAYVNTFYAVVHGKYAVVVRAQMQDGGVYGTYPGAKPYDYRQQYGPVLKQFVNSIRFKD